MNISTVVYISSIAFQPSEALLLMLYIVSIKRRSVIQRFADTGIITKDGILISLTHIMVQQIVFSK